MTLMVDRQSGQWQDSRKTWIGDLTNTSGDYFGLPVAEVKEPPVLASCLVFNSPHSGRHYQLQFLEQVRLDRSQIRRSEDFAVDQLVGRCVEAGAPLLSANFPRAYVDVNREAYELDPRMFDGPLPSFANTGSQRVASGLGSIPKTVGEGWEIYGRRLPVSEIGRRIEHVYKPYHRMLRRLLIEASRRFGQAVLIDCHSMPSSVRAGGFSDAPDIVLGDRHGMSASAEIIDMASGLLRNAGFTVVRNKPYAGGFITEHYGRPLKGFHALQIEINRALYMNEATLELTSGFQTLRTLIGRFALDFSAAVGNESGLNRLAAE